VKQYMYDLLRALDHMHRNGIFHRDVKPENVLLMDDVVKLADLGSCRGIYSRQPYTEYISTRWYRAPECLLTDGYYNFKMDLFATGCVWFELVAMFPLFPGQNEMDQIQKIHNVLGTPTVELLDRKFKRNASHMDFNFPEKKGTGIARLIPHADAELVELMNKLTRYDPDERILARQALKEPYFRDLRNAEKESLAASGASASVRPSGSVDRSHRSTGEPAPTKVGMSASSSCASIGHAEAPEVTGNVAPSRSVSPPKEEANGWLPTIRHGQEQRKGGGGGGCAGAVVGAGSSVANNGSVSDRVEGASGSEAENPEDVTVLPPIGVRKVRRDSKSNPHAGGPFKTVAQATLKPYGATAMSSTGAISASHAQNWESNKYSDHGGAGKNMVQKMNQTWAPNEGPRKQRQVRDVSLGTKKR